MTIGTPDSARICRQTSIPSIPGSIRSSSTRSGLDSRNTSIALSPSATKVGSNPSPRKTIPSISARAASSSTTSTRPFISLLVPCRRRWGASDDGSSRTRFGTLDSHITRCDRLNDPAFCHDGSHQGRWCHVERWIVGGCRFRRYGLPSHSYHFGGRPVLNRDPRAVGCLEIHRRQRGRHHERHLVVAGQHGQAIGAHLVGH